MSDEEIIHKLEGINKVERSEFLSDKLIESSIENLRKIISSEIKDISNNLLIRLLDYDDVIGNYKLTEDDETSPYYHSQDAQLYMSAVHEVEYIYNVDCSKIRLAAKKELTRRGIDLNEINKNIINNNPLRLALLGTWICDEVIRKEVANDNYITSTNKSRPTYSIVGKVIIETPRSVNTYSQNNKFITSTNRRMKRYSPNGGVIYKVNENIIGKYKFTLTKKGILREIGKNKDGQTISNFYNISITGSLMKMDELLFHSQTIWTKLP